MTACPASGGSRRVARTDSTSTGFTLLEVLAVLLLTSLVLGVALNYYVDLSRASARATGFTREIRRATAILDYVARDLEAAFMVARSPDTDPLEHPWIFLGESHYADGGSDHLKFVVRGREARHSDGHESDLAMVAYTVRESAEGNLELWRWTSPRIPEGLDRSMPRSEDDGALLLADGIASFAVSFLDEAFETHTTWDSSTLLHSGELPVAVDISVRMARPEAEADADAVIDEDLVAYHRRVLLPVRPVDLEVLLDPRAFANGGTGTPEETGEGGSGGGNDDPDDPSNASAKGARPCDDRTVGQAMRCVAPPDITDPTSLERLCREIQNQSFRIWRKRIPRSLHYLIKPECRD